MFSRIPNAFSRSGRLLLLAAAAAALVSCASQETTWRKMTYGAIFLYQDGRYDDGITVAGEALDIARLTFPPADLKVLQSVNCLVSLYFAKGDYDAAEPLCRDAISITEQNYGPSNPKLISPLENLACVHLQRGEYEQARALYRRSLSICETAYGSTDPQVLPPLESLAMIARTTGNTAEACSLHAVIGTVLAADGRQNSFDMAENTMHLADQEHLLDRPGRARALYDSALAVYTATGNRTTVGAAFCMNGIASLLVAQREYDLARPYCVEALQVYDSLLSPRHMDLYPVLRNCATVYEKMEMFRPAAETYTRMVPLCELVCRDNPARLPGVLHSAGLMYMKLQEYDAAEPLLKRAAEIYEQKVDAGDVRLAVVLEDLADLYKKTGNEQQMLAMEQKAYTIRSGTGKRSARPEHPPAQAPVPAAPSDTPGGE